MTRIDEIARGLDSAAEILMQEEEDVLLSWQEGELEFSDIDPTILETHTLVDALLRSPGACSAILMTRTVTQEFLIGYLEGSTEHLNAWKSLRQSSIRRSVQNN